MSERIRTKDDLLDAMDAEFSWRKKELSGLKSMVISTQTPGNRDLRIRAAVSLLYAHWEGFIKAIGTMYVHFVSEQRLKHGELSHSFLALAIGAMVQETGSSSKIQPCLELVEFFRSDSGIRSNLSWTASIQTKGNLSAEVLREIVLTLGLDYSRFETKEKLLNEKLLKNRNNIAHGKFLVINMDEYLELHEEVFGMMQDFYNQVDNSASADRFKNAHG